MNMNYSQKPVETKRFDSLELLRSISLDREDLAWHCIEAYPDSYRELHGAMAQTFAKSELLIRCQLKFGTMMQCEIPEAYNSTDLATRQALNLSLIFTGPVKAGKSSILNVILNTKIFPTGDIGSGMCIELVHPKNESKQISVGIYEWSGWEVNKFTDISIEELPEKIREIQKTLTLQAIGKDVIFKKKLKVTLPHWFLKNTNIFKCSSIDGMYSFEEPMDLIGKNPNPIMFHVVDATNGLMEWDRIFLSRIKYKNPNLPIFFIINRVDIGVETMLRDNFQSLQMETSINADMNASIVVSPGTDSGSERSFAGGGGENSNDDAGSCDAYSGNEPVSNIQDSLIKRSRTQIMKLGFAIDAKYTMACVGFSVKRFLHKIDDQFEDENKQNTMTSDEKVAKKKRTQDGSSSSNKDDQEFITQLINEFFRALSRYLEQWLKRLLVTEIMELKSHVNGVVDSVFCEIANSTFDQEVNDIMFYSEIKKKERSIADLFHNITTDIEKQLTKSIKNQLKKHENKLLDNLIPLKADDVGKVLHMMRPRLQPAMERVILSSPDNNYCVNRVICHILDEKIRWLDKAFKNLLDRGPSTTYLHAYVEDMYHLYRALKSGIVYPHVVGLPDEFFEGASGARALQEMVRNAARKIMRTDLQPLDVVQYAINCFTVAPLISNSLASITQILDDITDFTRKYQETHKMAKNHQLSKSTFLSELILSDFVLMMLEKAILEETNSYNGDEFVRIGNINSEFYYLPNIPKYMFKITQINSFRALEKYVESLCFKRLRVSSKLILFPRKIELMSNGQCVFTYLRMESDLYDELLKHPNWSFSQIIQIMIQITSILQTLELYSNTFPICVMPTNIMLQHLSERGKIEVRYCPLRNENSTIHSVWPTDSTTLYYQLGLLMLCIIFCDPLIVINLTGHDNFCHVTVHREGTLTMTGTEDKTAGSSTEVIKAEYESKTRSMLWEKYNRYLYDASPPKNRNDSRQLMNICDRLLFVDGSFQTLDAFQREMNSYLTATSTDQTPETTASTQSAKSRQHIL